MSGLFAPQITAAQGTTYLTNLGQASNGSLAVGNDGWLAIPFLTGNNSSGYSLDSVQLAMTDASGNPSDFTVMLDVAFNLISPGSSLGTLNGSLNPATGGIYTYTPDSNITLLAGRQYFIVLTAGTAVGTGAYDLSTAGKSSYNRIGNWAEGNFAGGTLSTSIDGQNWNEAEIIFPQFAIYATPVPEPSTEMLLSFGGILLLGFGRWKAKSV